MISRSAALLVMTSLAGGLIAAPAHAADAPAPTAPAAADDNGEIADIVVTANKRAQSLLDVGQTVSALSGETLTRQNVVSLENIAAAVPGLSFSKTLGDTPILTLRGVGFNEESMAAYPAVSAYIDEVPLPFPILATHALFDVERIEVLKGPQGTLFGQNSTGGAVNFIAAKPTRDLEGGAAISYGRFNRVDLSGYISGPLSSNLTARLAVQHVGADDWQRSYTRNDSLGQENYTVGRAIFDWQPSSTVHLALTLNGWIDKSDPQAQQYIVNDIQIPPFASPALNAYPFAPADPRAADWSTGIYRPRADKREGQAALRADVELGGGVTLTSLTSYTRFRQRAVQDRDGVSLGAFDQSTHDADIKSFSQEVRLANSGSSVFRWVVGANYEKSIVDEFQQYYYPDISGSNPISFFIYQSQIVGKNNNRNVAAFANGEFEIAPQLTIKAGARYTDSRQRFSFCASDIGDGRYNMLYDSLGLQESGTASPPLTQGQCVTLNYQLHPGIVPFQDTLKEHNVSWRAGVDYKPNADTLLYVNVSKGFKAGSYAIFPGITWNSLKPLRQESLLAYEAGFKLKGWDNRLQFSAAAFYYDYRNKQVRSFIEDPFFGSIISLVAVPKSRVAGAEADLTVRPVPDLTLSASGTYLSSKVQRYSGFNVVGRIEDFAGSVLPFTPRWSGSISADYKPVLAGGGSPFVGATVTLRSQSQAVFHGDTIDAATVGNGTYAPGSRYPFLLKGYALVDLRAGYAWDGDRYEVSVYGQNVFNKFYVTNSQVATDTIAQFVGRPATYGIRFAAKFK